MGWLLSKSIADPVSQDEWRCGYRRAAITGLLRRPRAAATNWAMASASPARDAAIEKLRAEAEQVRARPRPSAMPMRSARARWRRSRHGGDRPRRWLSRLGAGDLSFRLTGAFPASTGSQRPTSNAASANFRRPWARIDRNTLSPSRAASARSPTPPTIWPAAPSAVPPPSRRIAAAFDEITATVRTRRDGQVTRGLAGAAKGDAEDLQPVMSAVEAAISTRPRNRGDRRNRLPDQPPRPQRRRRGRAGRRCRQGFSPWSPWRCALAQRSADAKEISTLDRQLQSGGRRAWIWWHARRGPRPHPGAGDRDQRLLVGGISTAAEQQASRCRRSTPPQPPRTR